MWKRSKARSYLRAAVVMVTALGLAACSQPSSTFGNGTVQSVAGERVANSPLLGTWDVSLYFSADAPPSSTQMIITAVGEDGTLAGTFYGSSFEVGRYVEFEGETRFTVVTSDGSGPYLTSGTLGADGMIQGQTLATGREFLMAWTAERG